MSNVLVSVSGGRTSAYMASLIKENWKDDNLLFIFASTGEEHDGTLEFVDKVDKDLDLNLKWVEAKVNKEKKSSTYRIVNAKTASRAGEPFVEVIKKYGIPNKSYPHCTRELKINPIHSFAKEFLTASHI